MKYLHSNWELKNKDFERKRKLIIKQNSEENNLRKKTEWKWSEIKRTFL